MAGTSQEESPWVPGQSPLTPEVGLWQQESVCSGPLHSTESGLVGRAVGCHDSLPTSIPEAYSFPQSHTLCLFLVSLLFCTPPIFLEKNRVLALICESGAQNLLRCTGHFVYSPAHGLEVSPLIKSAMWKDSGFRRMPLSPLLQNRVHFSWSGLGFC